MNPDTLGLYVHIPFCKKKCNYCDFCSFAGLDAAARAGYLRALAEEISSYGGEEHPPVDTVFLGGGTPSLLTPVEITDLFAALRKTFRILPDAEITAEANPGTLDREKVDAFRRAGVNRLSIGLQSVHESELRTLGRIHSYGEFLDAYRLAKAGGIENIGVDLMYAFPGQTPASFHETLDAVTALAPSHISAYGLIVEDGTPFGERRETLILPDEDEELAMYDDACRTLAAAGYRHYEVSNYALPGRECRHNLRYWHEEEYIGFGVAAHSYYRGVRFANSRDLSAYSEGKCKQYRTKE
ncbi:MAG TPA: coproporphyrinogen III oxidase, partial [Clostridiales bacterium]|nr:coproporphyrinogen III oxidase [Clostridiales bacterium]